ncbi:MAG: hypothetical protein WKG01_17470 [Kofleriaceae bacterium]
MTSVSVGSRLLLAAGFVVAACGTKREAPRAIKDAGAAGPTVAPIATPPSGVDAISRFGFVYGKGATDYQKARTAAKTRDWSAVRTAAEAAIARDPNHLDAHRLLATALAQAGEHAAVVEQLVAVLAADYWQYAPALGDPDLKEFFATPHGIAVTELATKLRADYEKRTASGLLLIGRRSPFKWHEKPGVQGVTSRGELYAYDRETRRYLRLTHTEHQLAAFVKPAAGAELAILTFDKVDRPKGDDPIPLVARAHLQVLDTTEWKPTTKVTLKDAAREIAVGYSAGDQLLVALAPAAGRWGTGAPIVSSIDRATGKLTKVTSSLPVPRIVFTLEEGRLVRAPSGVKATWAGDPPTAPTLELGGRPIAVPESGAATQASIAVAPNGSHLAFATAVDPCAKDAAPSLYVSDAKGVLKHVLTAKSRFTTRWLDATTLAYEDGDGAIRLWDATTARESQRLENKPGLALDVLSIAAAPLCKQAPPTADTGSAEEPMPPEEGSAGTIITPPP